jgi:hypothetical protein
LGRQAETFRQNSPIEGVVYNSPNEKSIKKKMGKRISPSSKKGFS